MNSSLKKDFFSLNLLIWIGLPIVLALMAAGTGALANTDSSMTERPSDYLSGDADNCRDLSGTVSGKTDCRDDTLYRAAFGGKDILAGDKSWLSRYYDAISPSGSASAAQDNSEIRAELTADRGAGVDAAAGERNADSSEIEVTLPNWIVAVAFLLVGAVAIVRRGTPQPSRPPASGSPGNRLSSQ